mmetsp:Transcript_71705/g.186933  ORF Transcript_71705/g.186933 Transcript_71705/m.186933 type:complete len:274 (-) Transcript_71705:938-1759(-)
MDQASDIALNNSVHLCCDSAGSSANISIRPLYPPIVLPVEAVHQYNDKHGDDTQCSECPLREVQLREPRRPPRDGRRLHHDLGYFNGLPRAQLEGVRVPPDVLGNRFAVCGVPENDVRLPGGMQLVGPVEEMHHSLADQLVSLVGRHVMRRGVRWVEHSCVRHADPLAVVVDQFEPFLVLFAGLRTLEALDLLHLDEVPDGRIDHLPPARPIVLETDRVDLDLGRRYRDPLVLVLRVSGVLYLWRPLCLLRQLLPQYPLQVAPKLCLVCQIFR